MNQPLPNQIHSSTTGRTQNTKVNPSTVQSTSITGHATNTAMTTFHHGAPMYSSTPHHQLPTSSDKNLLTKNINKSGANLLRDLSGNLVVSNQASRGALNFGIEEVGLESGTTGAELVSRRNETEFMRAARFQVDQGGDLTPESKKRKQLIEFKPLLGEMSCENINEVFNIRTQSQQHRDDFNKSAADKDNQSALSQIKFFKSKHSAVGLYRAESKKNKILSQPILQQKQRAKSKNKRQPQTRNDYWQGALALGSTAKRDDLDQPSPHPHIPTASGGRDNNLLSGSLKLYSLATRSAERMEEQNSDGRDGKWMSHPMQSGTQQFQQPIGIQNEIQIKRFRKRSLIKKSIEEIDYLHSGKKKYSANQEKVARANYYLAHGSKKYKRRVATASRMGGTSTATGYHRGASHAAILGDRSMPITLKTGQTPAQYAHGLDQCQIVGHRLGHSRNNLREKNGANFSSRKGKQSRYTRLNHLKNLAKMDQMRLQIAQNENQNSRQLKNQLQLNQSSQSSFYHVDNETPMENEISTTDHWQNKFSGEHNREDDVLKYQMKMSQEMLPAFTESGQVALTNPGIQVKPLQYVPAETQNWSMNPLYTTGVAIVTPAQLPDIDIVDQESHKALLQNFKNFEQRSSHPYLENNDELVKPNIEANGPQSPLQNANVVQSIQNSLIPNQDSVKKLNHIIRKPNSVQFIHEKGPKVAISDENSKTHKLNSKITSFPGLTNDGLSNLYDLTNDKVQTDLNNFSSQIQQHYEQQIKLDELQKEMVETQDYMKMQDLNDDTISSPKVINPISAAINVFPKDTSATATAHMAAQSAQSSPGIKASAQLQQTQAALQLLQKSESAGPFSDLASPMVQKMNGMQLSFFGSAKAKEDLLHEEMVTSSQNLQNIIPFNQQNLISNQQTVNMNDFSSNVVDDINNYGPINFTVIENLMLMDPTNNLISGVPDMAAFTADPLIGFNPGFKHIARHMPPSSAHVHGRPITSKDLQQHIIIENFLKNSSDLKELIDKPNVSIDPLTLTKKSSPSQLRSQSATTRKARRQLTSALEAFQRKRESLKHIVQSHVWLRDRQLKSNLISRNKSTQSAFQVTGHQFKSRKMDFQQFKNDTEQYYLEGDYQDKNQSELINNSKVVKIVPMLHSQNDTGGQKEETNSHSNRLSSGFRLGSDIQKSQLQEPGNHAKNPDVDEPTTDPEKSKATPEPNILNPTGINEKKEMVQSEMEDGGSSFGPEKKNESKSEKAGKANTRSCIDFLKQNTNVYCQPFTKPSSNNLDSSKFMEKAMIRSMHSASRRMTTLVVKNTKEIQNVAQLPLENTVQTGDLGTQVASSAQYSSSAYRQNQNNEKITGAAFGGLESRQSATGHVVEIMYNNKGVQRDREILLNNRITQGLVTGETNSSNHGENMSPTYAGQPCPSSYLQKNSANRNQLSASTFGLDNGSGYGAAITDGLDVPQLQLERLNSPLLKGDTASNQALYIVDPNIDLSHSYLDMQNRVGECTNRYKENQDLDEGNETSATNLLLNASSSMINFPNNVSTSNGPNPNPTAGQHFYGTNNNQSSGGLILMKNRNVETVRAKTAATRSTRKTVQSQNQVQSQKSRHLLMQGSGSGLLRNSGTHQQTYQDAPFLNMAASSSPHFRNQTSASLFASSNTPDTTNLQNPKTHIGRKTTQKITNYDRRVGDAENNNYMSFSSQLNYLAKHLTSDKLKKDASKSGFGNAVTHKIVVDTISRRPRKRSAEASKPPKKPNRPLSVLFHGIRTTQPVTASHPEKAAIRNTKVYDLHYQTQQATAPPRQLLQLERPGTSGAPSSSNYGQKHSNHRNLISKSKKSAKNRY